MYANWGAILIAKFCFRMIFAWRVANTDLTNMSNSEALMEFPNEDYEANTYRG